MPGYGKKERERETSSSPVKNQLESYLQEEEERVQSRRHANVEHHGTDDKQQPQEEGGKERNVPLGVRTVPANLRGRGSKEMISPDSR